jgi:hypothetical protein
MYWFFEEFFGNMSPFKLKGGYHALVIHYWLCPSLGIEALGEGKSF